MKKKIFWSKSNLPTITNLTENHNLILLDSGSLLKQLIIVHEPTLCVNSLDYYSN